VTGAHAFFYAETVNFDHVQARQRLNTVLRKTTLSYGNVQFPGSCKPKPSQLISMKVCTIDYVGKVTIYGLFPTSLKVMKTVQSITCYLQYMRLKDNHHFTIASNTIMQPETLTFANDLTRLTNALEQSHLNASKPTWQNIWTYKRAKIISSTLMYGHEGLMS
jgi:hypothetical protein